MNWCQSRNGSLESTASGKAGKAAHACLSWCFDFQQFWTGGLYQFLTMRQEQLLSFLFWDPCHLEECSRDGVGMS